ncbi:putative MFS transporter [Metarhizium anisopliae]
MSKTPRDEECPGTSDSQTKEIAGHATSQPPYHKNDKNNNNTQPDNTQCEAVTENQVLEPRQSNERPLHSVFSPRIKVFVILMTVFNTIFSPFSSFIYLKAMTTIAKSYHRSPGEINLTRPDRPTARLCAHVCHLPGRKRRAGHAAQLRGANGPAGFAKHREKLDSGNWQRRGCRPDSAPGETILELKKLPLGIPVPGVVAAIRIIFEKDVGPLMLFMSLFATANYAMLVPLRDVIRRRHSFSDVQAGLCYIPFAMGSVFGAVTVGRLLNWNYARVANGIGVSADRKRGDEVRRFPIERARLDHMWLWTMLAFVTTTIWGWVVNWGVSLAAPLVILFLAGMSLSGPISILTILLVDLYPMNAGRASSSFNLTRAGISAAGTAVVQYIIDAWGYGFTYLFLALVGLAASPSILVVGRWGPRWREERYQGFGNVNV